MRKFPKSWTGWLLGLMGLALMAPGLAFATPISINNYSFEADTLPPGGQTNGVISGWALSSPIGINSEGVLNNSALSYYPSGVVPEGVNFAWSNGGTISQVLANTLQPGDYSLKVYVGLRADLDLSWPGYAVQLYAGDHLLGQESILTPARGTFALSTVNYHATGTNLYPGQALEIRLVSNGSQVSFDKVTLDYVPPPPTGTLFLLLGSD